MLSLYSVGVKGTPALLSPERVYAPFERNNKELVVRSDEPGRGSLDLRPPGYDGSATVRGDVDGPHGTLSAGIQPMPGLDQVSPAVHLARPEGIYGPPLRLDDLDLLRLPILDLSVIFDLSYAPGVKCDDAVPHAEERILRQDRHSAEPPDERIAGG